MSQTPVDPSVLVHFLVGFCLITAGRQTPNPLHRLFLTQDLEVPAGLKPQVLLAITNRHLCEQHGPPSHSSLASLIPFPHKEVAVLELVPVLEGVLELEPVPVCEADCERDPEFEPDGDGRAPDEEAAGPDEDAATGADEEAATTPDDEATTTPEDEATTTPEDEAATTPEDEALTTAEEALATTEEALATTEEAFTRTDEFAAPEDKFTLASNEEFADKF